MKAYGLVDPPTAGPDPALEVARAQLRLSWQQLRRQPGYYLVPDLMLWWLVARSGLVHFATAWVLVHAALLVWRYRRVMGPQPVEPADVHAELRWLSTMLVIYGVLRGLLALGLFTRPVHTEHYVFTMIYVGIMTSAVGAVGGHVRPFRLWCWCAVGPLALVWFAQRSFDTTVVGVLLVSLSLFVIGHVRAQGRALEQLVKLALDNERLAKAERAARDLVEAASVSKTRFFAAANHDLRQPLHALSINATTLEIVARREANPLIRELSQSIGRALTQSNSLLDSLLDISNLDADAVRPHRRDVDVGSLLGSVRDEFIGVARQKGIELELAVAEPGLTVRSDPDLLRRIVNNLVGNALKFTDAGSVTLAAAVGAADWIQLRVSDTGPGIPAAEQERVFEEFYQLGNPSRDRSKGLGLGLPIVKRTAALLEARLALTSAPGAGTTVTLELPRLSAPPAVDPLADAMPTVEPGMFAGLRVLVVDDEAEILTSLGGLLNELGCSVHLAATGAEAVRCAECGGGLDVLVVDHRLREESGIEVIARVRAVAGAVPAVIVTGDTEPAILRLAAAAGFRVIHKPVQGARLVRALREAIAGGPLAAHQG